MKKILIIDDDADLCREIAEIISGEGFSVQVAANGFEGQKYICANFYDAIIVDYKMPGINGVDILKFIKEKNIKTKVFVSSGRPFIEKILEDEKVSEIVTRVINKPFDIENLLQEIKDTPA